MRTDNDTYFRSEGCVYGPPPPWLDEPEPDRERNHKKKWLIAAVIVLLCAVAAILAVALA